MKNLYVIILYLMLFLSTNLFYILFGPLIMDLSSIPNKLWPIILFSFSSFIFSLSSLLLMIIFSIMATLIDDTNLSLFENLSIGFITTSLFILLVNMNVGQGILNLSISLTLLGGTYYIKK